MTAYLGDGWRVLNQEFASHPDNILALRQFMAQCGDRHIEHDPDWVIGDRREGRKAEIIVYLKKGKLVGYAPITRARRSLRFPLGEFTVYSHTLNSWTLIGQPTIAVGEIDPIGAVREFVAFFRDRFVGGDGLFIEGIPITSPLHSLLNSDEVAQNGVQAVELGRPHLHCYAKLPRSLGDYERQLGSRSRRSLRYSHRKLMEYLDCDLRTEKFTEESTVELFVTKAQEISRKTYQWKLLGLGLRDAPALCERLKFAARNGWLRSYLLYCRDRACAFMLGYQYNRTYFYIDVGYDPEWARWSVGSLLQMEVTRDLLQDPNPPTLFDFSTGTGSHKQRFGNEFQLERNFLLVRRGAGMRLLTSSYRVVVVADAKVGALLDKYDLKRPLKRWFRNAAMKRGGVEIDAEGLR